MSKLDLKTGILVPKVVYDLTEFKIRPWDHIAIIHTWRMEQDLPKNVSRIVKIIHSVAVGYMWHGGVGAIYNFDVKICEVIQFF